MPYPTMTVADVIAAMSTATSGERAQLRGLMVAAGLAPADDLTALEDRVSTLEGGGSTAALSHIGNFDAASNLIDTGDLDLSPFTRVMIVLENVQIGDVDLQMRLRSSSGVLSTAIYDWVMSASSNGAATANSSGTGATAIPLNGTTYNQLSGGEDAYYGSIDLYAADSTVSHKRIMWALGSGYGTGNNGAWRGEAAAETTAAITGVQISPVSGTLTGTMRLYGLLKDPAANGGNPPPTTGPLTLLSLGSSTQDRMFTEGTGTANARVTGSEDGTAFTSLGTTGTGALVLGNALVSALDRDVRYIRQGEGGTLLSEWEASPSTLRAAAVAAVQAAGGTDGAILGVGFNDARNAKSVVSAAAHATKLRSLISKLRTEVGNANLPIFIAGSQKLNDGDGTSNAQIQMVREAELEVAGDANVYLFATVVDLPQQADGIHLTSAGYTTWATRGAVNIIQHFTGGAKRRGPKVLSAAAVSDTQTRVTLQHGFGTDFTPVDGITGFTISTDNFASTVPIVNVERETATTILIDHNSTGNSVVTAGLRYQAAAAPVTGGAVMANSTPPFPMEPRSTSVTYQTIAGTGTPPPATYQFVDTFSSPTGAQISSGRLSDSGHALTILGGTLWVGNTNAMYPMTKPATGRYAYTPASANFDITWNMIYKTDGPNFVAIDVADVSNFISAGYNGSGTGYIIGRMASGTFNSPIGTSTVETMTGDVAARLEVRGEQLTLFINDVQKAQATIAGRTNGPIGVRWGGSAGGSGSSFVHTDNLRVREL